MNPVRFIKGTAAALNENAVFLDLQNARHIGLEISGTFSGTLTFQTSFDNVTWFSMFLQDADSSTASFTATTTGTGPFHGYVYGRFFRVRMTSFTSGAATVNVVASVDIPPQLLTQQVVGLSAHDSTTLGNPVLISGVGRTATPVAVSADNDNTRLWVDRLGRPITALASRTNTASGFITLATTTETELIAAGAAGVFHDLTSLILANTSATAVRVDMRDALGGAVKFAVFVPASDTIVLPLGDSPIEQAAAVNAWTAQLSAAVTDVRIFGKAIKLV